MRPKLVDTREELFQASIVLSAHMLTYIRVKAKRGSHPSLATKVTGGCLLPVGMVIEAVSAHSCVFSVGQNPLGLTRQLQHVLAASGLLPLVCFKLPLDSSS